MLIYIQVEECLDLFMEVLCVGIFMLLIVLWGRWAILGVSRKDFGVDSWSYRTR